jgi:hypothetical protein
MEANRGADAAPVLTRALSLREKQLGSSNEGLGNNLQTLAEAYLHFDRAHDALPLRWRALSLAERRFGVGAIQLRSVLVDLAEAQPALGRRDEARQLLARADAIVHAGRHTREDEAEVQLARAHVAWPGAKAEALELARAERDGFATLPNPRRFNERSWINKHQP